MSSSKHTPGPWDMRYEGPTPEYDAPYARIKAGTKGLYRKDPSKGFSLAAIMNRDDARLLAVAPIPQDLYDSEINFEIAPFYDAGFDVRLGDSINGLKAIGNAGTYVEALELLRDRAIEHYPESEFAKRYRGRK